MMRSKKLDNFVEALIASVKEGLELEPDMDIEKAIWNGYTCLDADAYDKYLDPKSNVQCKANEDKQVIADSLCNTLKYTRGYSDIENIEVSDNEEIAYIQFEQGTKKAYIACDSGEAMIRDILEAIR